MQQQGRVLDSLQGCAIRMTMIATMHCHTYWLRETTPGRAGPQHDSKQFLPPILVANALVDTEVGSVLWLCCIQQ